MTNSSPNIVLVLADDMGFSDLGCYGGEITTPVLNHLAAEGIRLSHFYNSPRCSPSRASLLTGLYPHQTGIGILTDDDRPDGYAGNINESCVTLAEVLREAGYGTYMSGKWHLTSDVHEVNESWPTRRGFDRFFGSLSGAGNFYDPPTLTRQEHNAEHEAQDPDFFYTDAIVDNALRDLEDHLHETPERPFFLYMAFTAPHFPLHAPAEDIELYEGRFDEGWDSLREKRLARLVDMGMLSADWDLTARDPSQPAWADAEDKEWQARRMEVYAAMIERMDRGIGRVVDALSEQGALENTIVIFLSDNGGCAEELPQTDADLPAYDYKIHEAEILRARTRQGERIHVGNFPSIMPGPENTYASYGRPWANLSNTPFREYKHWVHEGGISAPFIMHWPAGISDGGEIIHQPFHLPDVMATLLDAADITYPARFAGHEILPAEGRSLLPALSGEPGEPRYMFWEHEGNAGVRYANWKLVRKFPGDWELYDMQADRTELRNLASERPELVEQLSEQYELWATRCGVIPRESILALYAKRASGRA